MRRSLVAISFLAALILYPEVTPTPERHMLYPRDGERVRALVSRRFYDVCFLRHAATHCYGAIGSSWSGIVVDAMKGFR